MANRTDPLAAQLSGQDPQNLIEYITRQRIYESRYWKETCFGLSVADVLEKASELETIGGLPTPFLSLLLKLLQLNTESELIIEGFIEQDQFKYARALGAVYLRLTGRPADIYESLEPLYADHRKLRHWQSPYWSIKHMDELVHDLFTESFVCGITLPRLPTRKVMQDGGYLPEGPRETVLRDVLLQHGGPLDFLQHKALVEKFPPAVEAWEARPEAKAHREKEEQEAKKKQPSSPSGGGGGTSTTTSRSGKPKKKKARNYDNLFKKSKTDKKSAPSSGAVATSAPVEGSKEYWDEQRAKLGLAPLRE